MTQNQPSAMQVYLAMLTEQPERAETVLDEELLIAILAEIEALPSMWDYKGWQRQEENRYRVAAGVYGTTKRLITTAQVGWAYKKFKGDLKNRLKFSIVYKKHDTTETERYLRKWSLYNHLSFLRSTIRKEEAQYRAIAAKKPVKHQWMISLEKARAEAEELRKAKENSIQHQIQQGPPSDDVREVLQDQLVNSEPTESQNPVQQPTMPIGDHSSERSVQGAVKQKFQDNSSDLSPEKTRSQEPEAPSSTQRHYQWSIILWSDQDRDDWNSKSVYIEQSRASTAENRTRESVIRFGAHSSERPVQRGLKIAVTDEFPELFHTPERTSQDQCSSHAEITHEQTRLQQAPSSSQRPPCSRPSDNRVRESVIRFGTHSLERPVQRGIKIAVTDEFPELFHTPERTSQDQCSSHAEITHEQTRLQQAPSSSLEALMNQKPFNLSLHQSPPHTQSRQTQTERSIQQPPFIQCESCFSDEQGHDYQDFPRAQISHNRKSIWPHRSQELSQHRPSRNQLDHRAQGPVISQNNMRSPDSFGYRAQRPFNRYNDKFGSSCGTPGNDDVSPSTLRRQSRVQQTPHQEHQCAVENDKMLLKPIFAVAEQLVRRFPAQKSKELVYAMRSIVLFFKSCTVEFCPM